MFILEAGLKKLRRRAQSDFKKGVTSSSNVRQMRHREAQGRRRASINMKDEAGVNIDLDQAPHIRRVAASIRKIAGAPQHLSPNQKRHDRAVAQAGDNLQARTKRLKLPKAVKASVQSLPKKHSLRNPKGISLPSDKHRAVFTRRLLQKGTKEVNRASQRFNKAHTKPAGGYARLADLKKSDPGISHQISVLTKASKGQHRTVGTKKGTKGGSYSTN